MTDYDVLKNQGAEKIADIEAVINNQENFDKLSTEDKVDMFKDYLFLKVRLNPWFDESKAENIYEQIETGIDSLDEVLYTVADRIKTGEFCLDELNSPFMTESIIGYSGNPINNVTELRDEYIKSIEEKVPEEFHDRYKTVRVEVTADSLKHNNSRFNKLSHELESSEQEIDKDLKKMSEQKDIDEIFESGADAIKFDQELNQIENDALEEIRTDQELEELFPENVLVEEKRRQKEQNRSVYVNAYKKNNSNMNAPEKKEDDITDKMLFDLENDLDNYTNPAGQEMPESGNQSVDQDQNAYNYDEIYGNTEFNIPEVNTENNTEDLNADELFSGNNEENIQSVENEQIENINDFDQNELNEDNNNLEENNTIDDNNQIDNEQIDNEQIEEGNQSIENNQIHEADQEQVININAVENVAKDRINNDEPDVYAMLNNLDKQNEQIENEMILKNQQVGLEEDAKDAADLIDNIDKDIAKNTAEVDEKINAYEELDRTERILENQEKFEATEDKLSLVKSYLLSKAILNPDYSNHMKDELVENLGNNKMDTTLKQLLNHVKSGNHIKEELDGTHINYLLYGNVYKLRNRFMENPDPYDESSYSSKLYGIERTEQYYLKTYGSYDGKTKTKEEKQIDIEFDNDVNELFPENENNNELKEKEEEERKERIRQRKKADEEKLLKEKQEKEKRNKLFEESGAGAELKDTLAFQQGTSTSQDLYHRKHMTPKEAEIQMRKIKEIFCTPEKYAELNILQRPKLIRDYLYAYGVKNRLDYNILFEDDSPEFIDGMHEQLDKAVFHNSEVDNTISPVANLKDGKAAFKIFTESETLKRIVSDHIDAEYKNSRPLYFGKKNDILESVEAYNKKIKREEEIRKNPKKGGKNLDNYIIIHTGSKAGSSKEEMLDNLAKVSAAVKMKNDGAKFDINTLHETAKRYRTRFPKIFTDKPEFEKQLNNAMQNSDYAYEFCKTMQTALFKINIKKFAEYQKDMKKILENMSDPKGRTDKYQNFYNSVKAITEIKVKDGITGDAKDELMQKITNANEAMYDATHAYIQGKEKVRRQTYGKKSFDNALDVLSTVAKHMPSTKLCTMKIVDDINGIRKKDKLDRDKFFTTYSANRAAEANAKKTNNDKTKSKEDVKMVKGK